MLLKSLSHSALEGIDSTRFDAVDHHSMAVAHQPVPVLGRSREVVLPLDHTAGYLRETRLVKLPNELVLVDVQHPCCSVRRWPVRGKKRRDDFREPRIPERVVVEGAERDSPTGLEDTRELREDTHPIKMEERKCARHDIEGAIFESQRFGVHEFYVDLTESRRR